MEAKELSAAEKRRLLALNDEAVRAQAALTAFVEFLRDQHTAPASAWDLRDVNEGFTRRDNVGNG